MKEQHSLGPEVGNERGIATFVLVGSRRKSVPDFGGLPVLAGEGERAARFDLPSDAVRAAVAAVSGAAGERYAAVTTGEYRPESLHDLLDRLRAMNAVGQPGQVVVSLATQEIVRTSLEADFEFVDLGSLEVLPGHLERLFLVGNEALSVAGERPARPTLTRRLTTFLGRANELEEVRRQLDLSRIVSVVGSSGIGKTALLQRLVTEIETDFRDGVTQVDLSAILQPALLGPTLVRLVGAAKLPGEDHIDALIEHLRPRQALLVLDNAEHLAAELRKFVTPLADACPDLAILIGSHRPLRVPGEWRYKLEGMETPVYAEDWRAIGEYDSVALFVDRAQMVDPRFRLDAKNAAAIASLCQRLDGIPLAIELAASKTQTLSPRQILDRLDDRFLLLKDSDESRPHRQRTLETTVAWGYQHLRPEARALLRRLSVFQGAFTVDQAIEVCTDESLTEDLVLPSFEELVEGSMLANSQVKGPEKRFHLTETIRIYARARLREAKEDATFIKRHRDWCVKFGDEALVGLSSSDQFEWLDRLDATYEDIRSVIERNLQRGGDGALAIRLLLSIYSFYMLRHYLAEGLRVVDKVSSAPVCAGVPELHRVLNLGTHLATMLANDEVAREYAIRCVRAARKAKDEVAIGRARATLAHRAAQEGRPARACRHYLAGVKAFRKQGDEPRLLRSLISIAASEPSLGRIEEAKEHLREAGQLLQKSKEPILKAYFHQNSAHVALMEGNPLEALVHIRQAYPVFAEAQETSATATCLRNAAYVFELLGAPKLSARFVGAGLNLTSRLEHHMRSYEEEGFNALRERLQESLGPEQCSFETFQGSQMSADELLTLLAS
jgi:predicted ATPase